MARVGLVWYEMVFGLKEARVQLYLDRRDSEWNKAAFDKLKGQQSQIEARFGAPLEWNRMEGVKGAQIQYAKEFNGRDQDEWPEIIAWLVEHINKLEQALRDPLQQLRRV